MTRDSPPRSTRAALTLRFFVANRSQAHRYLKSLTRKSDCRLVAPGEALQIGIFDGTMHSLCAHLTSATLECPQMRPLLILDQCSDMDCFDWMLRGVWGVVPRDRVETDLPAACRQVAGGRPWFPAAITVAWPLFRKLSSESPRVPLTFRQCEIIHLLSMRFSNKEIASELGITERTVKYHLTRIFTICAVTCRQQLASLVRDIR